MPGMAARIPDDITFRKLETLLAFLDAGSLSRAAERLGTTPVSVHRALHSLERGVGCPLFRLEGRNLLPTDAARELADAAQEALRTLHAGIRGARAAAGFAADRLRIGSLYSLTIRAVPALAMGLKVRLPHVQTELVLGSNADLLLRLRNGEIDAALMGRPESAPDIESQALFDDDICFAAPAGSRYAGRTQIDLADCATEHFVSLTEGFVTYTGFMEAFRVAGFAPNVVMQTGDIFSLMNLVGGGVGCTLLPGRVRGAFSQQVELIPLHPRYLMRQTISLSFLRTRERDPNLLALLTVCRSASASLGGA